MIGPCLFVIGPWDLAVVICDLGLGVLYLGRVHLLSFIGYIAFVFGV